MNPRLKPTWSVLTLMCIAVLSFGGSFTCKSSSGDNNPPPQNPQ